MNKMKVELVKVKINKLKEVKKQLRKKKCSAKKNLKNLLLDNEEREHKDDIFYQSINAIFQDENNNNETITMSSYSDDVISDYHIDLGDLLESLGGCSSDISKQAVGPPPESLAMQESNLYTEERKEDSTNLKTDDHSINSFSYLVNYDNLYGELQEGGIYLCDDFGTESVSSSNSNKGTMESSINMCGTILEPDMLELGNYYTPDTVFETTADPTMDLEAICNEIEISIIEDPNNENSDEQIQHSEMSDPVITDLNNSQFEVEANNYIENEVIIENEVNIGNEEIIENEVNIGNEEIIENEVNIENGVIIENEVNIENEVIIENEGITGNEIISNHSTGVAMVNPQLVSIPAADLQTMALYQIQQKNYSKELENLGDTELMKNYTWEQKANIIAAAKMLYTKRTRTLLHWLDPNLSLSKMRATLELSWQNLPKWQKEVYISHVMGPLVMEATLPMINPQLKPRDFVPPPTSPKKPKHERKKFSDFIMNL